MSTVVAAQVGEAIWFGGGLVRILVTTEQSGGAFAVIEDVMPRGKTTPLHVHPMFDESIYVVEGELLVHVDGVEHVVNAGGLALATRGSAHAFVVTSEEARIVGLVTPGDVFERFLREAGDAPKENEPPPPLNIEKVAAAGQRTGAMEVLGPPPFDLAAIVR